MTARWWSQEFAPEGSTAAEGIVKQLGQPSQDPLAILIREAAQNSADARRDDVTVVDFRVDVRRLGEASASWRAALLPATQGDSGVDLAGSLSPDSIVIVVSDRNTVGLGGAIRANTKDSAERRSDFVQFLRNVGEPSDHEFGGGTYGFGKGVFYRLSRCGTILVDTHTSETGDVSRRLMGAALGPSWIREDRRYTGRHWWGQIGDDGIPDPLLGPEAVRTASLLGLPGFEDGRTGTDVVVVGAELGLVSADEESGRPRTAQEAATYLASAILWNLWPKFIPDDRGHCMHFAVSVDGNRVELPSPEEIEDFEPFIEALKEVRAGRGAAYTRVTPPKTGGSFGFALSDARAQSSRMVVDAARPFRGPSQHVARMRSIELVVDYVTGPTHPNQRLGYGGVFKASEAADRAFAQAEPPTHDDWVTSGLRGSVRGVVQGARTFLTRTLDERVGIASQSGGEGQGLGPLAHRLGAIVPIFRPASGHELAGVVHPSTPGSGVATDSGRSESPLPTGPTATPYARSKKVPRIVGTPALQVFDGTPYFVARVLIPSADQARSVTAEAFVVLEGGSREIDVPTGAATPRVVQWRSVAGAGATVHGDVLDVPGGPDSEWWIYASHVPDAVIRFRLSQVAVRGQ